MSESYETFSLDDIDASILQESSRFKAKDGESYRVSFAWFPLDEDGFLKGGVTPKFIKASRHYVEGNGYIISQGAEWDQLASTYGSKGKKLAFGSVIIVWPTDRDGAVEKSKLATGWKVQTVILDKNKFSTLLKIHNEWNLSEVDINISCPTGGGQYQKLNFMNCKENLLAKIMSSDNAELKAKISKAVADAGANVRNDLGRDVTIPQLKSMFGLASSEFKTSSLSNDDVNDLLSDTTDFDL